jgi:hypothetical protein
MDCHEICANTLLRLYGLYGNTLRNILQQLPQFMFQQMLFGSLGMHANTPRNCNCCFFSISVHITCCMTSTNPYGTACSSLLSEIRTSLCFGMSSLLRQMLSLFSAQPLSCSSLVLSTRMLQLSCSWHLTKNLLASHQ